MKKIFYIASLCLMTALTPSCDALDLAPEDYYGAGNYWDNASQVESYMLGLHSQFRGQYDRIFKLGESRGGTLRIGTSSIGTSLNDADICGQNISADTPGYSNFAGFYTQIMQVNHFITEVENGCDFLSEQTRSFYLGQAYGLRAYYYFSLFRTYGGVPLITVVDLLDGKPTAEKFYVERATPEATMAFIKEDINKSEQYFGSNNTHNVYMWSKYATLMLKAEIYMWSAKVSITGFNATGTADLQTAKAALQGVMGQFQLLDDYASIYSTKNKKNKELIFALPFVENEATNWGGMFLYQDALFIGQAHGRNGQVIATDTLNLKGSGGVFRYEYKEEFFKTYKPEDTRRDGSFLEYYMKKADDGTLSEFGCMMTKMQGTLNSTGNHIYISDIMLYRYSDVLLMMAECENGLGNPCASYINEVRARAYGDNFAGNEYVEGTYAENELAILQERDKEFVGEGKRWYDVLRMHDANGQSLVFSGSANYSGETGVLPTAEAYKMLWPLDKSSMNVNPLLEQTPGY